MVQLSHLYMTTGKTTALTIQTFVSKVISLVFNMLFRFVIAFLPRSKCLLLSWLQSPSAVILEPKPVAFIRLSSKLYFSKENTTTAVDKVSMIDLNFPVAALKFLLIVDSIRSI